MFTDTAYQGRLEQIIELMQHKTGKIEQFNRAIYLQALKQFGRNDGLEIYRKVKQWRLEQEEQ